MKFLLVDDEHLQLQKLIDEVNEAAPGNEICSFNNPLEALEFANNNQDIDVAFLDIEMPEINGVELAKKLKEIKPTINIIFVTGYSEYALSAYTLHASGYLTKPVNSQQILAELSDLRFPMPHENTDKNIRIQCFGDFEVFNFDNPVRFSRSKSKELLAYIVDKQGTVVSNTELSNVLFNEDKPSYIRNLVADIIKSLKECGAENIIIKHFNGLAIDTKKIECDYYDYLNNEPYAVKKYRGEYMNQYEWAKTLKRKHFKK